MKGIKLIPLLIKNSLNWNKYRIGYMKIVNKVYQSVCQ